MGTFYEVIHSITITWPDILIRPSRARSRRMESRRAYIIPVYLRTDFTILISGKLLIGTMRILSIDQVAPVIKKCGEITCMGKKRRNLEWKVGGSIFLKIRKRQ